MVDFLITILVHCALLGLVFLVLSVSRDQRPCVTGTVSTGEDTMRITVTWLPEDDTCTISQECITKKASGVAMRMNKP